MNDSEEQRLLTALAKRLAGPANPVPGFGQGTGIARPAEMDSPDAAVARDARSNYAGRLLAQPAIHLSRQERDTIRDEITAVLADMAK